MTEWQSQPVQLSWKRADGALLYVELIAPYYAPPPGKGSWVPLPDLGPYAPREDSPILTIVYADGQSFEYARPAGK